jgi:hypothetical protein
MVNPMANCTYTKYPTVYNYDPRCESWYIDTLNSSDTVTLIGPHYDESSLKYR